MNSHMAPTNSMAGKVALVTGGAQGLGAGVARRLSGLGAKVVIADVNGDAGAALAADLGATFVHCDVSQYDDNLAAVAAATSTYGGLDTVILNAGVASGLTMGEQFDVDRYRQVMGINLDGVVFGFNAALPALRARGGGKVVATASLAGLTPVPMDPVYAANKSAVVALVRSLAGLCADEGIEVNAVCPAFADTAILGELRGALVTAGVPLLSVDDVVDVFLTILEADDSGQCWYVQPGRPAEPFAFRRAPGPRTAAGSPAPAADPKSLANPHDTP
ncbi:MAG: SDR family NAD(P)-dependent oxidoreductase [Actinomycetes bacterium]